MGTELVTPNERKVAREACRDSWNKATHRFRWILVCEELDRMSTNELRRVKLLVLTLIRARGGGD
jgi:hypothetical protein